jgi:hypothetical protein
MNRKGYQIIIAAKLLGMGKTTVYRKLMGYSVNVKVKPPPGVSLSSTSGSTSGPKVF